MQLYNYPTAEYNMNKMYLFNVSKQFLKYQ